MISEGIMLLEVAHGNRIKDCVGKGRACAWQETDRIPKGGMLLKVVPGRRVKDCRRRVGLALGNILA